MTLNETFIAQPNNYRGAPIVVYYTSYVTPLDPTDFTFLLQLVPQSFREKIYRFTRWQDAHASLLGRMLLLYALREFRCDNSLDDLAYTEYNRPYIPGAPDFSISHSGNMVVCAVSQTARIGIDLEHYEPLAMYDFLYQFSPKEWMKVMQSNNSESIFYQYWTIKEAVLKAEGTGLYTALSQLDVSDCTSVLLKGCRWYITSVDHFNGYACSLATSIPCPNYCLREVSFFHETIAQLKRNFD